jgi:hypothetical protein
MAFEPRSQRSGVAWLILIFLPPVLILAGLIAVFIWQGSKGGIQPKWKAPSAAKTNVPPSQQSPAERP